MPFDGANYEQPTLAQELVAARLRYARNQIADGKWCQRAVSDMHGNHCVVGWLEGPSQFLPDIGTVAMCYAWAALPASQRANGGYYAASELARYNDTHKRQTIVRLLDRAIVAAETTQ